MPRISSARWTDPASSKSTMVASPGSGEATAASTVISNARPATATKAGRRRVRGHRCRGWVLTLRRSRAARAGLEKAVSLAAVGGHLVHDLAAAHQEERVEVLAQLAGLGVAHEHVVAHGQRPGRRTGDR